MSRLGPRQMLNRTYASRWNFAHQIGAGLFHTFIQGTAKSFPTNEKNDEFMFSGVRHRCQTHFFCGQLSKFL